MNFFFVFPNEYPRSEWAPAVVSLSELSVLKFPRAQFRACKGSLKLLDNVWYNEALDN